MGSSLLLELVLQRHRLEAGPEVLAPAFLHRAGRGTGKPEVLRAVYFAKMPTSAECSSPAAAESSYRCWMNPAAEAWPGCSDPRERSTSSSSWTNRPVRPEPWWTSRGTGSWERGIAASRRQTRPPRHSGTPIG